MKYIHMASLTGRVRSRKALLVRVSSAEASFYRARIGGQLKTWEALRKKWVNISSELAQDRCALTALNFIGDYFLQVQVSVYRQIVSTSEFVDRLT